MVSENDSVSFSSDEGLNEVIEKIQSYEDWVVKDKETLEIMDQSIVKVMEVINRNIGSIKGNRNDEQVAGLVEAILIVLGFMPVKKALVYLISLQNNVHLFEAIAEGLNSAPPLKAHAKTLLARANVLQQRELQKAVSSPENFLSLSQALERTFEKE